MACGTVTVQTDGGQDGGTNGGNGGQDGGGRGGLGLLFLLGILASEGGE